MFPKFNNPKTSLSVVDVFKGYNHNPRIGEGEFFDMKNLSSDLFPLLSTRKPRRYRKIWDDKNLPTGIASRNGLTYTALGSILRIGDDAGGVAIDIDLGLNSEPKDMIFMGAYLIIMPDKKWLNTANNSQHGDMEALFQTTGSVTLTPCKSDGEAMTAATIQATAPESPKDKDLWVDTSDPKKHVWKEWSQTQTIWITIAKVYIKISAPGISKDFKEGDGIRLDFGEAADNQQVKDLNGMNIIRSKGLDYIVVTGIIDKETQWTTGMDLARELPNLDYVIESGNRLWGCRYGLNKKGEFVNEIYCSKLGDFKNWNVFDGISTDSYIVSLGTDGPFTGAVSYRGMPHFFKADHMHIVYGRTLPFQLKDIDCRGVQRGCEKSLTVINEVLYYKSQDGFCAFDGSLPVNVSKALGMVKYINVKAATVGDKYYASCIIPNPKGYIYPGTPEFLVFDTARGMWHKEDSLQAHIIYDTVDDVVVVDLKGNRISMTGLEGNGEQETEMPWMAETGIIAAYDLQHTYLRKLRIRFAANAGSRLTVAVQYDSSTAWEDIGTVVAQRLEPVSFPVVPRRCDHLRIRLRGTGPIQIYAITREMSGGSSYDCS